jgi:hypothetical protein
MQKDNESTNLFRFKTLLIAFALAIYSGGPYEQDDHQPPDRPAASPPFIGSIHELLHRKIN